MKISFHGGAREVTGACYLVESGSEKFLVDCGLFQGSHECSEENYDPFRFNPLSVSTLFVTHAHLDHVGRIPKLVRDGFEGTIYSTAPTRDLARLLLEDALSLGRRRDAELYNADELERTFGMWNVVPYGEAFSCGNVRAIFRNGGHILGSAMIEVYFENRHLLFTGDLGNTPSILLPPPEEAMGAEYLIIESTYGAREHEDSSERAVLLERAVEDVSSRGGTLMIPAFATERVQDILFLLNQMLLEKRIPEIPMFVDSPLARRATQVFESYPGYYREEAQELLKKDPEIFRFKKLRFTGTVEESKAINAVPPPKVVIAGSGMMTGGRIIHHLKRHLGDRKSILLIVGYQPSGSLGRRLIEKEKSVTVLGEEIPVEAEVRKINGFSAHADSPQLFSFVQKRKDALRRVFVVQGEESQSSVFMQEIKDHLGIHADVPRRYESFEL
jgi:metallo-beta-lactamase family protein